MEHERASKLARRGELVEAQACEVLKDIMKRAGMGETLQTMSIKSHFDSWLVSKRTRSAARHARRLSQRSDTRMVGNGVAGGFLRIFEAQHSLSWAKRFIARHETNEVPTGAAFLNPESPTSRRNLELAVRGGRGNRTQQMGDGNNN